MSDVVTSLSMKKRESQLLQVSRLYVGVSWKSTGGGSKGIVGWGRKQKGTDLDVCAVGLDPDNTARGMAWFDDQDPYGNGSLVVSEDDKTGKRVGEFIIANLEAVPLQTKTIVFEVSAFKSHVSFANVSSVTTTIVDQSGTPYQELGTSLLPIDNPSITAVALCKVTRTDDPAVWTFEATERFGSGRSKLELINLAKSV